MGQLKQIILTIFILTWGIDILAQAVYPFKLAENKWCFVDSELKRIDRKVYHKITPCELSYFYATKKGKVALVNKEGKRITDFAFNKIWYSSGFIAKSDDSLYSIGREGTVKKFEANVGHCGTNNGYPINFLTYKKNNKIGVLDYSLSNGKYDIDSFPAIYDKLIPCFRQYALVKIDSLWGVIDMSCKFTIEPYFNEVKIANAPNQFVDGIIVCKNKLCGWLNKEAKITIEIKYKDLTEFKHGYSYVTTTDNKSGYITEKGMELFK